MNRPTIKIITYIIIIIIHTHIGYYKNNTSNIYDSF